jgi:LPXTG-motif cell wall-anchored protein
VVAAAAATSVLSLCGSPALADSNAGGATNGSPGVLSGNTVQVPIHVPVNACGNTVDVIALLNPAFGNSCADQSNSVRQVPQEVPSPRGSSDTSSTATPRLPVQTSPSEVARHTPAVGRTPAHRLPAPADQSRHNAAASQGLRSEPSAHPQWRPGPVPMGTRPSLAQTGSEAMLATSGVSAALLAGGLILYRRGRAAHRR